MVPGADWRETGGAGAVCFGLRGAVRGGIETAGLGRAGAGRAGWVLLRDMGQLVGEQVGSLGRMGPELARTEDDVRAGRIGVGAEA